MRAARLRGTVHVAPDPAGVAADAAAWIVARSAACIASRGEFAVALAGGTTPRALYAVLAAPPHRDAVPWGSWRVFFGDERACPPDDEASNYRLAREALLDLVPIPAERIHRIPAERPDLDAVAVEYSSMLAAILPPHPLTGAPRLDVALLGLGGNGHTASLFPGTPALAVRDAWAARGRADYAPFDRVTLTYPALDAAAAVVFLVVGEAKRDALRATAAGDTPAAAVAPVEGELHWFLDRTAAEGLP